MRGFRLLDAGSLDAACALLDQNPGARAIAGGTALISMIKHGLFEPETLVNLWPIQGADTISEDGMGGIRIGALASLSDIARHPLIMTELPLLASASRVVANVRIRNVATIGGNLAHADSQSDPPAALVALDASLDLVASTGFRSVPLQDFIIGSYETALRTNELVAAIRIPVEARRWTSRYWRFTTHSNGDRPMANAAVRLKVEGGLCTDLRVVVGAQTAAPTRLLEVERMARGEPLDAIEPAVLGNAVGGAIEPTDDIRGSAAYKRMIGGVLVERALRECIQRASGSATE